MCRFVVICRHTQQQKLSSSYNKGCKDCKHQNHGIIKEEDKDKKKRRIVLTYPIQHYHAFSRIYVPYLVAWLLCCKLTITTCSHNLQSQLAIKADDIVVRINATIPISNSQVFALLSTF